jgi:thioredoxin 2
MSPSDQPPLGVVACAFCSTLNRVDLTKLSNGPKCANCRRPILLDRPIMATAITFDRMLKGTTVPVLVDFYADWCGPCRMMAPALDEFARERTGEALVLKLDTDANPASAARFGIRGIPTLIAFRDGKESRRHVGMADRRVLDALVT